MRFFQKYLATLLPGHGLAAFPWDGLALLLRVVEAVLLGHVGAVLVPDHVARLRWHVLALLPLHLVGGKNEALNIGRFGERLCRCREAIFRCSSSGRFSVCLPVWARHRTFGRRHCGKQAESLMYTAACGRILSLVWTDGGFSLDKWWV